MNQLAGKDFAELAIDGLEELKGLGIAGTEHVVSNAPYPPYLIRAACAAEIGIDAHGGYHVSGQVNLGNDGDEALCCVGNDFAHLFLGVVASLRGIVVDGVVRVRESDVLADDGAGADACLLCQFGKSLHLEAPTLVVCKMPVKNVQFVECTCIEHFFYKCNRKECAAGI